MKSQPVRQKYFTARLLLKVYMISLQTAAPFRHGAGRLRPAGSVGIRCESDHAIKRMAKRVA